MYVKYLNGTVVELVKAKFTKTIVQNVDVTQVPPTDLSIVRRLGLKWQEWVVNGAVTLTSSVMWRDIAQVSLDNVSWRNCVTTAVDFPRILIDQTLYELRLNVSPILEGAIVRYPSSGYKWGNQSIMGISQAGNVNAYPIIHYLAPLFYAPLSNTLIDFAGQAVTFTRTASKVHGDVTYPINTPIFDNGLYLASDTAQDLATWTPPASTVRTVAMRLKSRYPSLWSIGGGGVNILTANQSNAETDTTGMLGAGGTFTRDTSSPIAGAADFKVVSNASRDIWLQTNAMAAVTAGRWYAFQSLCKVTAAAGRQIKIGISWFDAGNAWISDSWGTLVACPTTPTTISVMGYAPATATKANVCFSVPSPLTGEILYADSLMLEAIPTIVQIWTDFTHNGLAINTVSNLLSWTDVITTVSATFPTALYLAGIVVDIVLLDDTAHAVTVIAHAAGGTWYTATGTLAAIAYPALTLNPEGSIANLIEYPYVLTSAEYQALAYSSLSLRYNNLYIGNRYADEIVKGSDGRLVNVNGADISALLGGVDIAIGSVAVTIAQLQGLSARWYVELQRTDV